MSKIEPKYITYEQANLLDEKGFDEDTNANWWILASDHRDNKLPLDESKIFFCGDSDELESKTYIDDETIHNVYHVLSCPEQWMVVEWLRINHGIEIYLRPQRNSRIGVTTYYYGISTICSTNHLEIIEVVDLMNSDYLTPQDAYSAAIDYVLNNLL